MAKLREDQKTWKDDAKNVVERSATYTPGLRQTEVIHRDYAPESCAVAQDYNLPQIAGGMARQAMSFTNALEAFVRDMTGSLPVHPPSTDCATAEGMVAHVVDQCNIVSNCTARNDDLLNFLRSRL